MDIIKKSILIITYDMIPYASWGGCQRMYYLGNFLVDNGYDTILIHKKKSQCLGDFGHTIQFTSIPVGKTANGCNSDKQNFQRNNKSIKSVFQSSIKKIIRKFDLSKLEKIFFNEPNKFTGILGYLFLKESRDVVFNTIKTHDIKCVIISGPPFSLFQISKTIKKQFPHVKIILDYRDPWNTPSSSYILPSFIEKRVLEIADKVVFVNDKMLEDTIKKYHLPPEKGDVIYNGYSQNEWELVESRIKTSNSKDSSKNKPLIISYLGVAFFNKGSYRDLTSFLDAFAIFQKNRDVIVRLIGMNPPKDQEKLFKQFDQKLQIFPPVNTQRAMEYMLESDVLFLLHTDPRTARYVLTGKFFDYIRSGKIIFGIGCTEDTYFLEFVKEFHLGISSLSKTQEIFACLKFLYDNWEKGTLHEMRDHQRLNIDFYSRESQNLKYTQIIENLYDHKD